VTSHEWGYKRYPPCSFGYGLGNDGLGVVVVLVVLLVADQSSAINSRPMGASSSSAINSRPMRAGGGSRSSAIYSHLLRGSSSANQSPTHE